MKLSDKPVEVPPSKCPSCHAQLNFTSAVNEQGETVVPSTGSVSVCVECGMPLVFQTDLTLRKLTKEDLAQMEPEEKQLVAKLIVAIRLVRKMRSDKQEH